MSEHLSAYEQQRAETMARNREYLVNLGIDKPLIANAPKTMVSNRKRKAPADESLTEQRTTRRSAARTALKNEIDDDDYIPKLEGASDDDDDYESLPKPKVLKKQKLESTASQQADACIVVENAKTGRSKCRHCLEMLAAGALRVGMESWMVGRRVMVWQHPLCFASGLHVTTETSGRGKCKQTKAAFSVGEHRISATAHSTTAHFKLTAAPFLLRSVFAALPEGCKAVLPAITGWEQLLPHERREFEAAIAADAEQPRPAEVVELAKPGVDEKSKSIESNERAKKKPQHVQPPKGRVSKAKGRVCWKFAGALCYGTLLPAKETAGVCFARTHKGNVKTLTKGGAYWWTVEE